MDCKTALALIDVYLDNELERADARAIEAHLDTCPECAAALARADGLRRALRDPALHHAAPQELRERIRAAADPAADDHSHPRIVAFKPRAQRASPGWWRIAAACTFAFVGGGASMQWWNAGRGAASEGAQLERDLFAAHWRALASASPVDVVSSDHHTVKPWFAGKLAESPQVRDFATDGFALAGGRIDYVGAQRVAVLVYRHGLHLIDVFVLSKSAAPTLAAHMQANGYAADTIALGGQPAVVVSDMDSAERARFAHMLGEAK